MFVYDWITRDKFSGSCFSLFAFQFVGRRPCGYRFYISFAPTTIFLSQTNRFISCFHAKASFFFSFLLSAWRKKKKKKKNPRGEYGQLPPMLHVFEFAAVPRWLKPPAAKRGAACSISGLGGCIYGWAKKCCCKRRFVVIYCCYPNGCFQLICSPPLQIVPHNKGALTVLLR